MPAVVKDIFNKFGSTYYDRCRDLRVHTNRNTINKTLRGLNTLLPYVVAGIIIITKAAAMRFANKQR